MSKPSILVDICCGPCATHVVEALRESFDVTALFYGSNIHPAWEYARRRASVKQFASGSGLEVVYDDYDPDRWLTAVIGLEGEPEGGARCPVCFETRLSRAAMQASDRGIPTMTTTLTVSPHKDCEAIAKIGKRVSTEVGIEFFAEDFKQHGGFHRSVELSKSLGLYRQRYCGCRFSIPLKAGVE